MTLSFRQYLSGIAGILVLLVLVVIGHRLGGIGYLCLRVQQVLHAAEWREKSLWLPDYKVVIEAKPITGIDSDLSALAYNPERNTLFSVTNKNPELVEISLEGQLLRRVPLTGFSDPEAIEYLGENFYLISDESTQRLIKVYLDDNTMAINAEENLQQLSLRIDASNNKGFEGLTYDKRTEKIFVAKEKHPVRIYEIQGFLHRDPEKPFALDVLESPQYNAALFMQDISSLDFDEQTKHLLVLSDDSYVLVELAADGKAISSLSLLMGQHGLKRSVMQAEGVTMDHDKNLYIIGEPNLLYVFRKS